MKHDAVLTVAITGMNAVPDNPGAGLAVARCLREAYGQRIRIVGLGILQVRKRAARMGRNPATGEAIQIKASKKVAFRAAKELKEDV